MPTTDEDLMGAITAGISEAGGTVSTGGNDADDENSGASADGGDGSGTESAASGEAVDEGTPDSSVDGGEGTGEPTADGEKPDGEGEKPAGETADPKAAAKADGKDKNADGTEKPARAPDPLNDPIPNALKKETKERIQTLISTVKTTTTERDMAKAELGEMVQHIFDTGATPEQYGETLGVLKMINSTDVKDQEQAFEYLQGALVTLGARLGKPVPGVDMLAEHPDLQEAVSSGTMLQQHAEELAAARKSQAVRRETSTQQTQQRQQQAAQQAAETKGKADLNAVGNGFAQTDPNFKVKHKILVASLKGTLAALPPDKWASTYKNAYENLDISAFVKPTTPVPGNNGANKGQPMRHRQPAGGGNAERAPGSILDAVTQAIRQTSAG